jgi:hypothetical protein
MAGVAAAQRARRRFEFAGEEFRLDGKPFMIAGGELHPARIPRECWRRRIRMTKAMGGNTVACYIFWKYQERRGAVRLHHGESRRRRVLAGVRR